ncbi:MAG: hypothetical protein RI842_09960 [Schleiferiaceae bacterium]|nr:hypothetical protein [Schleiferiaceae bacterium]
MKNFSSLSILVIVFFLLACEKNQENARYTLRGRLLRSCDNPEPAEGVQLGLWLEKSVTLGNPDGPEFLDHVVTGPNGEFALSYDQDIYNNIYIKKIREPYSTRLLMMGIPRNKSLDVGTVFNLTPKTDMVFSIKTPYSFSSKDTLKIGGIARIKDGYGSAFRPIPGPFSDGQIVYQEKDAEGTVQTFFPDSLIFNENRDLIDPDYIFGLPFHFSGHRNRGSGIRYFINSCETRHFEIKLDSSMLGE